MNINNMIYEMGGSGLKHYPTKKLQKKLDSLGLKSPVDDTNNYFDNGTNGHSEELRHKYREQREQRKLNKEFEDAANSSRSLDLDQVTTSRRGKRIYPNRNPIDLSGNTDRVENARKLVYGHKSNSSKKETIDDYDKQLARHKASGGRGPASNSQPAGRTINHQPVSKSAANNNFLKNHWGKVATGAGIVTAAGIGKMIHSHNKNKGILNKIKNNPGKSAGIGLGALAAGAGVAALIRHLRKKKK